MISRTCRLAGGGNVDLLTEKGEKKPLSRLCTGEDEMRGAEWGVLEGERKKSPKRKKKKTLYSEIRAFKI